MVIKERELGDRYCVREVADSMLFYGAASAAIGVGIGQYPGFDGYTSTAIIAAAGAMFFATTAYEFRVHSRIVERVFS